MIAIVNKKTHRKLDRDVDFYIGRGSPVGNPFTHIPSGTKALYVVATLDLAIENFEKWLTGQIHAGNKELLKMLLRIKQASLNSNVNLVCYCSPKKCHGDILKLFLETKWMLVLGAIQKHIPELGLDNKLYDSSSRS